MVSKDATEGNTCTLGATVVKIRHECIGGVLGFGKTVYVYQSKLRNIKQDKYNLEK